MFEASPEPVLATEVVAPAVVAPVELVTSVEPVKSVEPVATVESVATVGPVAPVGAEIAASDATVRMWFADGTELPLDEQAINVTRMRDLASKLVSTDNPSRGSRP
jgi:hypothetical protein